ncbi:hypothetical protein DFS34DRAFT_594313 [Phlyctochytrium arcticum]|nr:hypothetical protein DFS34DRAFT_594313 [Phlyctochytrium arcticum]
MSSVMRAIEERARALIAQHGSAAAALDAQLQDSPAGPSTRMRQDSVQGLIAQHGSVVRAARVIFGAPILPTPSLTTTFAAGSLPNPAVIRPLAPFRLICWHYQ